MLKNKKSFLLFSSVILGSIVGCIFKEKAIILRPLGTIFINLLFTIVVPLIFFMISYNVSKMEKLNKISKILKNTFLIFGASLLVVGIFTLVSGIIVNPLGNAKVIIESTDQAQQYSIVEKIVSMLTVNDFAGLFSRTNIVPLIIFSILFGICTNLVGKKAEPIKKVLESGYLIMNKFIGIIFYYAPIGMFAYFAALIGEYGPSFVGNYMRIGIMYLVLGILNVLIFHTIYLYIAGGKECVKSYYKNILIVITTALSTQSSVATMPTNMKCVEKMKVPEDIKNISVPIGTVLHMEGNIIQAVLKIILLYSVFGMEFKGFEVYGITLFAAIVSSLVSAGLPGGGVAGDLILIGICQFPITAFPIIATIEWMLDSPATAMNVIGDTATVPLIALLTDGKSWRKEKK